MKKYSVLFVCLGNICRSPLGEAVFRHLVTERKQDSKFHIESCGTGHWHVGEGAHHGSVKIAKKHGIDLSGHCARQVAQDDFSKFELLVAMDRSNRADLEQIDTGAGARIVCMRDYDLERDSLDVPDPYYKVQGGFQAVFDIIHRSCLELLNQLDDEL